MKELIIERFPPLSFAGAEAINALCTNLSFAVEDIRKIMITSCHASEGKSYLAMNIMRTMAKFGKNVALVDADLRCSVITTRYGLRFPDAEHRSGLAHYLAGKVPIEDVVYSTNIEGAYMVPCGREVSNPLSLLNTKRFGQLLDTLAEEMDCVLVDAPPVGIVIDGVQIAKSCDGAMVVVTYNSVHRQELIEIKNQLEQTECPILGTVLNAVEYDSYINRKHYYKTYQSDYGYYKNARHENKKNAKDKKA